MLQLYAISVYLPGNFYNVGGESQRRGSYTCKEAGILAGYHPMADVLFYSSRATERRADTMAGGEMIVPSRPGIFSNCFNKTSWPCNDCFDEGRIDDKPQRAREEK
jgi:hypothetical protein